MKMTISKKIYVGIGVLTAALIGLAAFFQMNIKQTKSELAHDADYIELLELLGSRTIDHYKWAEALSVGTILLGKEFTGQIDHTKCKLGEWYYSYKPPKELEETFKKIEDPHKRFHATAPMIVSAIKEGRLDAAKKIYQEDTMPALASTQEALTEMRKVVKASIDRDIEHMTAMQDSMGKTSLFVYIGLIVSLVSGSVIFLARPVKKNLSDISAWINTMATGDLTKNADIRSNDEVGDMASNLQAMVARTKNTITQTVEASSQVALSADMIADANQNFSQRITEQAAAIEETSSTMEEMSASIRQTADNAREANKLAQNTKVIADSGTIVMNNTITAMDDINKSSTKIGNISNVIEEIAFQTNLLALNAAVEAARAGEHGKGFAVVASEIRSLAQRTAQSAKEITGLIEDSAEKTSRGVQLAQELSKKLDEIGVSVTKVVDLMDEVAAAAGEQASGINQVNTAILQVDQMTQQNVSLVEETAASAEELAALSKELLNLISFFKVNERSAVESEFKKTVHAASHKTHRVAPREQAKAIANRSNNHEKSRQAALTVAEGNNGGFEEF